MKYITLIIGLLVIGCLTPEQKQWQEWGQVKALRDSVVGEYEYKKRGHKFVFLENGTAEGYVHGNRQKAEEYKWSIVDGEIYVHWYGERIGEVYRINTDKSITLIVSISDGKRTDRPKDKQITYKKIK
jgi:hypothetical protein